MSKNKDQINKQAKDAIQLAFSVPGQGVTVSPEVAQRLGYFIDNAALDDGELEEHYESLLENHHGH